MDKGKEEGIGEKGQERQRGEESRKGRERD